METISGGSNEIYDTAFSSKGKVYVTDEDDYDPSPDETFPILETKGPDLYADDIATMMKNFRRLLFQFYLEKRDH